MTNIPGKSHFNPTVKNYHVVPHLGQISSSPATAAVADSFPHAGNSRNGKSSQSQNTARRLQVLHAELQAARPGCTARAPPALHCTGAAAPSTQGTQQCCSKTAQTKGYSRRTESDAAEPWKSTRLLRQDSSFMLQYRIWRIPMTVFTFTLIMTQSESQPLLIRQILMLLFWQCWAMCCHKNRNIKEVKWQK